jgi:hypothetical protein
VQRRDLVVESLATLVETPQVARQRLVDEGRRDRIDACRCRGRVHLLEQIEKPPGIAVGKAGQAVARIGLEGQVWAGEGAGPLEELGQFVGRERLQHIHRRPRQQRRIDLEGRVLGGRADQRHQALLDVGQKASCWALLKRWTSSTKRMV